MPRLRRSKPTGPGLRRMRSGRGFCYCVEGGRPLSDAATKARIAALVIPPAWQDVWDELLAFRHDDRWYDVRSTDINDYLCEVVGFPVSAKDFRTWHGTVLAAIALAVVEPHGMSPTARKRVVSHAVTEVSEYLGNTPAVCRRSYIDPRVIDRFEAGETISAAIPRLGAGAEEGELASIGAAERAVLRLLS